MIKNGAGMYTVAKKKHAQWLSLRRQLWVGALLLLVLALTVSACGRETGTPSGQGTLGGIVGQPATAFSLKDAYGQTYTFTPGGGKPRVLVFYMGYF